MELYFNYHSKVQDADSKIEREKDVSLIALVVFSESKNVTFD